MKVGFEGLPQRQYGLGLNGQQLSFLGLVLSMFGIRHVRQTIAVGTA
ncbi:hypothetical protein [Streptomyces sp. NPDC007929]